MKGKQLQLAAKSGSVMMVPNIDNEAIVARLSEDDRVYLSGKQVKLANLATLRKRAEDKADKLQRKIEATPEFQELAQIKKNVKAMRAAEDEISTQLSAILEKAMPDVPGDSYYEKVANLAKRSM